MRGGAWPFRVSLHRSQKDPRDSLFGVALILKLDQGNVIGGFLGIRSNQRKVRRVNAGEDALDALVAQSEDVAE